jgi:hypothetical protein
MTLVPRGLCRERITSRDVTAVRDPEAARSLLSGVITQLRDANYGRTQFRDRRIQVLDEKLTLVGDLAVR